MKHYINAMGALDVTHWVVIPTRDIREVPGEVLNLFKTFMGVCHSAGPDRTYFWTVGPGVQRILRSMFGFGQYSGKYRIGRDITGYFWEEC